MNAATRLHTFPLGRDTVPAETADLPRTGEHSHLQRSLVWSSVDS